MKRIEAETLELAYTKAANELGCSVTELDVQVVQAPSGGILGLFKKPAVIIAVCKATYKEPTREPEKPAYEPRKAPKKEEYREPAREVEPARESYKEPKRKEKPFFEDTFRDVEEKEELKPITVETKRDKIVDSFNQQDMDSVMVCREVEAVLRDLFRDTCYSIDTIEVSLYDEKTLCVFFDGQDAALLIGKDGYRYKALSYVLFNWINPTYGYLLRLEIAEFLQNQEDMIAKYLEPVIDTIYQSGKGQTRVLDGVLVQIALKELRNRFPNKYVAIKTTNDGEGKFVVVNDFIRKNDR